MSDNTRLEILRWQHEELARGIDPSQIKTLQGQSYLPGYYTKMLLNRIFGVMGWDSTIVKLERACKPFKMPNSKGGTNNYVAFTCELILEVRFADGSVVRKGDVGGGSANDQRGNWGELVIKAQKSAQTDALKRAASQLGPAFGISLYDKKNPVKHQAGRREDSKDWWDDWQNYVPFWEASPVVPDEPAPPAPSENGATPGPQAHSGVGHGISPQGQAYQGTPPPPPPPDDVYRPQSSEWGPQHQYSSPPPQPSPPRTPSTPRDLKCNACGMLHKSVFQDWSNCPNCGTVGSLQQVSVADMARDRMDVSRARDAAVPPSHAPPPPPQQAQEDGAPGFMRAQLPDPAKFMAGLDWACIHGGWTQDEVNGVLSDLGFDLADDSCYTSNRVAEVFGVLIKPPVREVNV